MAGRHQQIYVVGQGTGRFSADGIEYIIVCDVKLTRAAADAIAMKIPNGRVLKFIATQAVDIQQQP